MGQLDTTDQIFSTLRLEMSVYLTRVITVEQTQRLSDGRFLVEGHLISIEFREHSESANVQYYVVPGVTQQELDQGRVRMTAV